MWCCGKDTTDRDLEVERARHSKSNSVDPIITVIPKSEEEQACNQDNETHKNTDSNQDSTDKQTTHEQSKNRRQSVRMSVIESVRQFKSEDEVNTDDWDPVKSPRKSNLRKDDI